MNAVADHSSNFEIGKPGEPILGCNPENPMNKCLIHPVVIFLLFAVGLTTASIADGLIKKLPPPGHWSTYDVTTSITQPDGTQTSSSGILTVRVLGQIEIDDKSCRWLEFELSWEQEPTENSPRRFHSSIQKIAIDESVFTNNSNPLTGILKGVGAKSSADEKPKTWNYQRPHGLKLGLGSASGFGVIDYYLRSPFDRKIDLGAQKIEIGDKTIDCVGIESNETNHKIGSDKNLVTSSAYRQWVSDETDFGVVKYQFEFLKMDGTSFSQALMLKEWGKDATSSLGEPLGFEINPNQK